MKVRARCSGIATVSLAVTIAGVLASASCGGKIDCGPDAGTACTSSVDPSSIDCSKRYCPNDPPIPSYSIAQCKAQLTGACAHEYAALYECVLPLVRCDATGQTDTSSSQEIIATCSAQANTYTSCEYTSALDAGGAPTADGGRR